MAKKSDNKVQIQELLKKLETTKTVSSKKQIRRSLRLLGHKGGLRFINNQASK